MCTNMGLDMNGPYQLLANVDNINQLDDEKF